MVALDRRLASFCVRTCSVRFVAYRRHLFISCEFIFIDGRPECVVGGQLKPAALPEIFEGHGGAPNTDGEK